MGLLDTGLLGRELRGRVTETAADVTRVSVGGRAMGLSFGTVGPEVTVHEGLLAPATPGMSMMELATVPTAFVTAAISFELAKLQAGDSVLVHAGAGGVGMAAIQLAQASGAEVFATASAPQQAYLRSLGVGHAFDSRQTNFGDEILQATNGAGVQVVLNSLTGEGFIEASLACLAPGGRFVELGRRDIWSAEEMSSKSPDVSYFVLDLGAMKQENIPEVSAALGSVSRLLSAGELTPLPYTRWPLTEAPTAMEFMWSARHVGKNVLVLPPLSRGRLREDRSYLVTGGLGGIGCAVAGWLADRGAGVIVLSGRRPPDPAAEDAIGILRERGVKVDVELADVTDATAVDGIAIVGMACRFPGAADLDAFWQLLDSGRSAVTAGRQGSGSRNGAVGDPDAGDIATGGGAIVDGIDRFDSRFFRISPIEARMMDPQQRMMLETTWQRPWKTLH